MYTERFQNIFTGKPQNNLGYTVRARVINIRKHIKGVLTMRLVIK